MSTKTVFFGYMSFLREEVDAAKDIMSKRERDYLWFCFDPSRVVQDGPASPYPNMSFSLIMDMRDAADMAETVADFERFIARLPFLSAILLVEEEDRMSRTVYVMSPGHTTFTLEESLAPRRANLG